MVFYLYVCVSCQKLDRCRVIDECRCKVFHFFFFTHLAVLKNRDSGYSNLLYIHLFSIIRIKLKRSDLKVCDTLVLAVSIAKLFI